MPYVRKTKRRPSVSKRLKIIAAVCAALAATLVFAGLFAMQQERIARGAAEAASFTPAPLEASSATTEPTVVPPTIEAAFTDGIPESVSGVPFRTITNAAAGSDFVVTDERLTNTATGSGPAASYLEAAMPGPVKRVGASFVFSEGSNNGAVMVGVWETSIVESFPTIPNNPAHLVVTREGWIYGIWNTEAGNDIITSGKFAQPLESGQEYTVDIQFDGETAAVTLPGGDVEKITDPRIAELIGPFPTWEVYQNDASTEAKAAFTRVWAS